MDDAREALDEARTLSPGAPELAELENKIASQPSPGAVFLASDLPELEPDPGWPRVVGAMAVLVVLFSLFGFGLVQLYFTGPAQELLSVRGSGDRTGRVGSTGDTPTSSREEVSPPQASSNAVRTVQQTTSAAGTPIPDQPAAPRGAANESAKDRVSTATGDRRRQSTGVAPRPLPAPPTANGRTPARLPNRLDAPATATAPTVPTASSERGRAEAPVPPPTATAPPLPGPTATSGSVAPATSGAVAATTSSSKDSGSSAPAPLDTPVPASRPSPSESRREESARIRSVLLRYENAYNRLDASAASSVWPGVDQNALDRAFKGLLSQRVSLGLCDITVIGDIGGASCAGKARWEPRVGGGLQTADRHWTFNLRKTADGWKIEQIRVR
jgi:hypothetical protein